MAATTKDKIMNALFKRVQHFFPLLTIGLWVWSIICLFKNPSWCQAAIAVSVPYLLPLTAHRILTFIYPLEEGGAYIGLNEEKFSPWLASLRIQQIYIVFPQLERLLFFLPGMYSTWLRLWGSKIGAWVFWVPGIEITDRSLVEVGDGVVFGNRVFMSSHLLRAKNDKFFVYVKKIKIGSKSFVGAFSRLGPGTDIAPGTVLSAGSDLALNQKINSPD
jgi:hypothetical protein